MAVRALDLFQAYAQDKLPRDGGYIISSFFSAGSNYSRYEVVGFNGVKSIYPTEDGLTFQTDGNKLFVLVEPADYPKKYEEPVSRHNEERIPHRFSELEIHTSKNQTKIMVSKMPVMSYSSFTVLKPTGLDFALIFYNLPDVMQSLATFFTETLSKEAAVPKPDAKKGAALVVQGLQKFTIW